MLNQKSEEEFEKIQGIRQGGINIPCFLSLRLMIYNRANKNRSENSVSGIVKHDGRESD